MDETVRKILAEVGALLRTVRRVVVLTGAGVSAESGVPTFRDAQTGLWAQYSPEELATPQAFKRNPRLVWDWYTWRRQLVANAEPNPGHFALAELERRVAELTLITQNVDGLHQRAGSRDVVELHGNIARTRCFREDRVVERWDETAELPPRCRDCGGPLRPDVVWFGELLPAAALQRAVEATARCELLLSIGTSGLVEPAASLPYRALAHGASLLVLNLDVRSEAAPPIYTLHGQSGQLLPALLRAAWPEQELP